MTFNQSIINIINRLGIEAKGLFEIGRLSIFEVCILQGFKIVIFFIFCKFSWIFPISCDILMMVINAARMVNFLKDKKIPFVTKKISKNAHYI